ncbi:hypothetical protein HHK36_003003 [Tetracentron sinense]|uniref:DNA-directed RNA polymerase subunit n=1 Tax=Tetracentron sinense TaxID=13715 RepID=A0A834ZMG4_TETSI|nr:hypothetical protein HHK36_003003 [Tetracentron sinense]
MEGLKVSYANLVVYVHPSKATKVPQAILRELSTLLFKFSEIFDGVVLAYDVNIQNKTAKILPGIYPYFGVRLKAKLLLLSPKPDMLLGSYVVIPHNYICTRLIKTIINSFHFLAQVKMRRKVVKLTKESIHVIVLGFSSATITEEDIREEFTYNILRASLTSILDEEILHISGSLILAQTGSIRWLDKHVEEGSQPERSTKKCRERDRGREMQEDYTGLISEGAFSLMTIDRRSQRGGEP